MKKPQAQIFEGDDVNVATIPPDLKEDQVLALDIATITGFCTRYASGTWDFNPRKDESKGMRLIRFRSKVKEMIQKHGIRFIAFESAAVFGKRPNQVGIEMIGVMKLVCEDAGIDYKGYPPASIKKYFTGHGHASKEIMIQTAQKNFGMQSEDDNEADAVATFHFSITDLGIRSNKTDF